MERIAVLFTGDEEIGALQIGKKVHIYALKVDMESYQYMSSIYAAFYVDQYFHVNIVTTTNGKTYSALIDGEMAVYTRETFQSVYCQKYIKSPLIETYELDHEPRTIPELLHALMNYPKSRINVLFASNGSVAVVQVGNHVKVYCKYLLAEHDHMVGSGAQYEDGVGMNTHLISRYDPYEYHIHIARSATGYQFDHDC